jgi:hypothetical protein
MSCGVVEMTDIRCMCCTLYNSVARCVTNAQADSATSAITNGFKGPDCFSMLKARLA